MRDEDLPRRLAALGETLAALQADCDSPALEVALRQAGYYCHLARVLLGEQVLSPDIDGALGPDVAGAIRRAPAGSTEHR